MTPPELEFSEEQLEQLLDSFALGSLSCVGFCKQINRLLAEKLAKCPKVRLGYNSTQIGDLACWYPTNPQERYATTSDERVTAHLVGIATLRKETHE
jgi:hypothetical protein